MSHPYPPQYRAACIEQCAWRLLENDGGRALNAARVHGHLQEGHVAHVIPIDPEPWWVDEAGRRYQHRDVMDNADEGEYGGTLYNLAQWKPRDGYSKKKEDYA